jgi:hypothetical protein
MLTLLYSKTKKTVNRILKKYGQTVVITTKVSGIYDPSLGSVSITSTNQSIVGAVFEWGGSNYPNNGQEVVDGSIIRIGDQKLILSPIDINGQPIIKPKVNDVVLVNGVSYTIVNPIKFLAPAGILVLVEANIRGAN